MTSKDKRPDAAAVPIFSGFPKAGMRFLRDLKRNNDRDWFRERKHIYDESVRAPMESLARLVAAECQRRGFALHAKEGNPITRIYRDIRFSPDKTPFHTHVGTFLKQSHNKTSLGGLYLHISPEMSFVGAGFWMPERPFVQAWRKAMAEDPKRFARVLTALKRHELELMREKPLTRLPRGFEGQAGSPLEDVFKLVSYVVRREIDSDEYSSGEMIHLAAEFGLAAKPLLEYGWGLRYAPQRDILDDRKGERL
jgi:uncharacterized protein (TIGR02453 family)